MVVFGAGQRFYAVVARHSVFLCHSLPRRHFIQMCIRVQFLPRWHVPSLKPLHIMLSGISLPLPQGQFFRKCPGFRQREHFDWFWFFPPVVGGIFAFFAILHSIMKPDPQYDLAPAKSCAHASMHAAISFPSWIWVAKELAYLASRRIRSASGTVDPSLSSRATMSNSPTRAEET